MRNLVVLVGSMLIAVWLAWIGAGSVDAKSAVSIAIAASGGVTINGKPLMPPSRSEADYKVLGRLVRAEPRPIQSEAVTCAFDAQGLEFTTGFSPHWHMTIYYQGTSAPMRPFSGTLTVLGKNIRRNMTLQQVRMLLPAAKEIEGDLRLDAGSRVVRFAFSKSRSGLDSVDVGPKE